MTPSNRHPETAARGLWRAFLLQAAIGLVTAILAAPAPALAQGLIEFSVGNSTFTRYQVRDDGTGLRTLPFPQVDYRLIHATTQSYSGVGRLYLYPDNNNLWVWSEATGQIKAVTNIVGPPSVQTNNNWSNDGLDSFFSFNLVDAHGHSSLYRAHVSAADIASPTFQPITLADLGTPRVEYVADQQGGYVQYSWSHDGSRYYYLDPRDTTKIRVKTVGVGLTFDDDPIVFSAAAQLMELSVIPPVDPLNPVSDRYLVAAGVPFGTGILAIDLATPTSWWLATASPTKSNKNSFTWVRTPCFSPDGSFIAFGAIRTDSAATPYYGVYAVPFFGGQRTTVTELKGSKSSSLGYVTVNNWNTP